MSHSSQRCTSRQYRTLSWLLLAALLLSLTPAGAAAAPTITPVASVSNTVAAGLAPAQQPVEPGVPLAGPAIKRTVGAVIGEDDSQGVAENVYLVQLAGAPVAAYQGELAGLAATNPAAAGTQRLDGRSRDVQLFRSFLAAEQAGFRSQAEAALGRPLRWVYAYQTAFNGFAVVLTPAEARQMTLLQGVTSVFKDQLRQKSEVDYHSPNASTQEYLGIDLLWDGSAGGLPASQGEGVIVGVIDTGIWPEHPSFADDGAYAPPPAHWTGLCQQPEDGTPGYECSNKLIGVRYFLAGYQQAASSYDGLYLSVRDEDGHGTHTASTAAGNADVIAAPYGIPHGLVSGMAPRAHVAAYKALGPQGGMTSDLVAAIDAAVADGVDVINYSIGSDFAGDPWSDPDAIAFLNALEANVFAAVSAGNAGPGAGTVGSPANAPWVTAVGAAYHDELYLAEVILEYAGAPAPLTLYGASTTPGLDDLVLVDAYGKPDGNGNSEGTCDAPFPPGTFENDEIVLCEYHSPSVLEHVRAGGAAAVLYFNQDNALDRGLFAPRGPAVRLTRLDGYLAFLYLEEAAIEGELVYASFSASTRVPADLYTDVLPGTVAGFSSRGPDMNDDTGELSRYLKPDLAAPGHHILAGFTPTPLADYEKQGELFAIVQGTSMSAPHIAGIGVLLRALHPGWSAAQIRSALMSTGNPAALARNGDSENLPNYVDEPATPFDVGSGNVRPVGAAYAGFTLEESAGSYWRVNPHAGGDPAGLNLPALTLPDCLAQCTFTRTLTNVFGMPVEYAVSATLPVTVTVSGPLGAFVLPVGDTVVSFTFDVSGMPVNEWLFGDIEFLPVDMGASSAERINLPAVQHLTVALRPVGARVQNIDIVTAYDVGRRTFGGIQAVTVPNLEMTLLSGSPQPFAGAVGPDPTNDDPYDIGAGGVFTALVAVSAGAVQLDVAIVESSAPDLDLYVGFDANHNGRPDQDEELCVSASGVATEFCTLPDAGTLAAGNYWILIQNWQGSGALLDSFIYEVTVIQAGGSSELVVELPASSTLGVPFAVNVSWAVSGWRRGEQRSAVLLLSDGDSGAELARTNIHVLRGPDDVNVAVTGPTVLIPGSVLTHTVTIVPEADDGDGEIVYQLVETLPAGMSYVAGSSTIGEPAIAGNLLTWHVTAATLRRYLISTSESDFFCETNQDYPDLKSQFGVLPNAALAGNAFNVPVGTGNGGAFPVSFDGQFVAGGLYVTADGLIHTNASNPATWPAAPFTALPSPALPNGLLAPFWRDLAVVYDAALGRGLSLYRAPAAHIWVAEWDGAEPAPAGSTDQRYSFAIAGRENIVDEEGAFEYIFYYGAMTNPAGPVFVGYENGDGSQGESYFAGDAATAVLPAALCLDYAVAPMTFTYALRIAGDVAAPATLEVDTWVDPGLDGYEPRPGARQYEVIGVHLQSTVEAPASVVPGSNIPMTIIVANLGPNVATGVTAEMALMPNTSLVSGGTLSGTTVLVALGDIPGFASRSAVVEVAPEVSVLPAAPVSAAEAGVIGGKVAAPGAWPWQAALLLNDVENNYAAQTCGGTLLSADWVLTAAHCLDWDASMAVGFDVLLGTNVLSNTAPYQRIPVAYGVIHPQADEAAYRHDTALLRLSEPAVITGAVGVAGSVLPVALLTAQDALLLDPSILLMATGWGRVSAVAPSYPYDLFQVQVPYVDQATCSAFYTALGYAEDTIGPDHVCAGFEEGGKDTCSGDSGGPLLLNVAGTWRQAGITSWGEGCAKPGAPGVYASVPHHLDWITLDGINTFVNGAVTVADATGDYTDFLPNGVVSVVFRAAPTALDPVDEPDAVHYRLFLPGVNR